MIAGNKMCNKNNMLIFLDEIQAYPEILTIFKFLKQDNRFTYICSSSLLGVTLFNTISIPIGSIEVRYMYPLDFEEFLYENGSNEFAIDNLKQKFFKLQSPDENTYFKILDLFKKYLLTDLIPTFITNYIITIVGKKKYIFRKYVS